MDEQRRIPGWVWPAAGMIAVVVLVVVGLNREPARFDPDTPEGTVQTYIASLVAGDFESAAGLWADEGCVPESVEPTEGAPDVSAMLVDVDSGDDEATVVVELTGNAMDPVGGVYQYQEWFTLVRQEDGWRIRQPSWPYYDQLCEEL